MKSAESDLLRGVTLFNSELDKCQLCYLQLMALSCCNDHHTLWLIILWSWQRILKSYQICSTGEDTRAAEPFWCQSVSFQDKVTARTTTLINPLSQKHTPTPKILHAETSSATTIMEQPGNTESLLTNVLITWILSCHPPIPALTSQ